mgnify:CR=1 FL=1
MRCWKSLGGTPLEQWLENRPAPVQAEDACAMLRPVFEGVAAMHKAGLVHRGICPENIRVMSDGRCRLAGYATVGLRTAGSGLHEQLYEGYSAPEQYTTAEFEGSLHRRIQPCRRLLPHGVRAGTHARCPACGVGL